MIVIWIGAFIVSELKERKAFNKGNCIHCGTKLEPLESYPKNRGKYYVCPKCGYLESYPKNRGKYYVCPKCGYSVWKSST